MRPLLGVGMSDSHKTELGWLMARSNVSEPPVRWTRVPELPFTTKCIRAGLELVGLAVTSDGPLDEEVGDDPELVQPAMEIATRRAAPLASAMR